MTSSVWLWLGLAFVSFICLFFVARSSFRRAARRDLIARIRARFPEVEVTQQSPMILSFKRGDLEIRSNLYNFYGAMAAATTEEQRAAAFDTTLGGLAEGFEALIPLNLEKDGFRLMPRLLTTKELESSRDLQSALRARLGATDLSIVYVIDRTHSVSYLTTAQAEDLGLHADEIRKLAMENLSKRFPLAEVEDVVRNGKINIVHRGDTFDAARLLLLPDALAPDQAVAALVPDRDVLIVMPVPDDGRWDALAIAASRAVGRPIQARPLRVTAAGFELH